MPPRNLKTRLLSIGAGAAALLIGMPAQAIDWGSVPGKELTLFYPGQSSWEWVLTPSDHDGAKKFRGGKACVGCHEDEQAEMGETLVSGEKIEPDPIEGKPGSLPVEVKTAFDDSRLYVRFSWADTGFVGPKEDPDNLIKVTMMLGDQTVPSYARGGCWATCHDDVEDMPSDTGGLDLTKYLARSRTKVTRSGGGTSYRSDSELQGMIGDGMFVEYWHAHVNKGAPAEPVDGYILDKRHEHDSPAVSAEAELSGGTWTVIMSRALAADSPTRKALEAGGTYTVGFAVHDGHADGRRHYVSFEKTLSLGEGDGDLVAVRQ
jgi:cytochrome c-type protein NapC